MENENSFYLMNENILKVGQLILAKQLAGSGIWATKKTLLHTCPL
jgi:hypothetical protein